MSGMDLSSRYLGRNVLITGAGGGIGCSIALRIAAEGGGLLLMDRNEEDLTPIAKQIEEVGGDVLAKAACDVTDYENVSRLVTDITKRHGAIDCLVHCAGIVGESNARAGDADLGEFRRVIDINLTGAFVMAKAVLPAMASQHYGRILFISSIAGKEGNPKMSGYVASKAGLIGLTKAIGKEYAGDGITVNALAPAVIATPMNEDTDPATLASLCEKIPMGRMGTREEAAALAAWICSEEASFNTGFTFDLSGGRATY